MKTMFMNLRHRNKSAHGSEKELARSSRRKSVIWNKRSLEALEFETAKEILGEVFNATPSDVEEMIQQRIMEEVG